MVYACSDKCEKKKKKKNLKRLDTLLYYVTIRYNKSASYFTFILCCYITKENNEEFKRLSSGFK